MSCAVVTGVQTCALPICFAATTTIAKRRTDTTHHYLNGYFSEVTLPGRSSTQELQAITPEPVRQAVGGGRGGNHRGLRHLEYPPPCHSPYRNQYRFPTILRHDSRHKPHHRNSLHPATHPHIQIP